MRFPEDFPEGRKVVVHPDAGEKAEYGKVVGHSGGNVAVQLTSGKIRNYGCSVLDLIEDV